MSPGLSDDRLAEDLDAFLWMDYDCEAVKAARSKVRSSMGPLPTVILYTRVACR